METSPTFRTLLSDPQGAYVMIENCTEGRALLSVTMAVEMIREQGYVVDDLPALNRNGIRRWRVFSPRRVFQGALYVEPVGNARVLHPDWLAVAGYPIVKGWWVRDVDGIKAQVEDYRVGNVQFGRIPLRDLPFAGA